MKKYILLIAVLLTGCGGSSSTPITQPIEATEPVEVTQPIVEVPSCPDVPECPPCPEVPVVEEPEPEIVTYYQKSTTTLNGEESQAYTYTDDGFVLTFYRALQDALDTYIYDDNKNLLSHELTVDGNLSRYDYYTFDENNNTLTHTNSDGMSAVYTYTDNNLRETVKVSQYGVLTSDFRNTYEGENLIKREYYIANRVTTFDYDNNDNLIYYGIWLNGVLTDEYTYTWQEFTEEIK